MNAYQILDKKIRAKNSLVKVQSKLEYSIVVLIYVAALAFALGV